MRRILAASLMGITLTAGSAFAADDVTTPDIAPAAVAAATALGQKPDLAAAVTFAPRKIATGRPLVLPSMYIASAALQGYDAYSTLTVLKHGGVEANPVMAGVTRHPAAFIGIKAGVTAASIMAAEQMWKNHNRVGAVLTMVVSNTLMGMVAANNARVLSQVR